MKRFIIATLLIAAILLAGCGSITFQGSGNMIYGSGKITSENREVSGFSQVEFSGSGEAQITQGDRESLIIEADDNIMPYLTSQVVNGTLKLGLKPGTSISTSRGIHYTLTVKSLNQIVTSGSLNVSTGALNADSLAFHTSGSGNVSAASAQAKTITVSTSGSGNVEVKGGKADTISASLSGSGNLNAPALESQSAHITTSGSGKATVWVKSLLDGSTSGSGDINYYGSPASFNVRTSGSGRANNLGSK